MKVDTVNLSRDHGGVNTTSKRQSDYPPDQFALLLFKMGVTGGALADRLGRSRQWVSGRKTGQYVITDDDAREICRELGVGIRELMAPAPVVDRYASVLTEIQVDIVDHPLSTDEEVQEFLKTLRHLKNFVLSNPDRANRKPRARKL